MQATWLCCIYWPFQMDAIVFTHQKWIQTGMCRVCVCAMFECLWSDWRWLATRITATFTIERLHKWIHWGSQRTFLWTIGRCKNWIWDDRIYIQLTKPNIIKLSSIHEYRYGGRTEDIAVDHVVIDNGAKWCSTSDDEWKMHCSIMCYQKSHGRAWCGWWVQLHVLFHGTQRIITCGQCFPLRSD